MIRECSGADAARIAEIERETFADPWTREMLEESFSVPAFCALCLDEGGIVAYITFYRAADEAHVANFAVEKGYRGRGLGRELLRAFKAYLADSGCARSTLEVRAGNAAAKRLYESEGFVCEGRRRRFYSDGEDADIYRLTL